MPTRSASIGEAAQGGDGGGVAERVGELLGEQDADRAGAPGAQGPAGGVGPCIAQLGRQREHALAQRRVELVGAVERVRRGGAGDAERGRRGSATSPGSVSHYLREASDAGYLRRRSLRIGALGSAERASERLPVMSKAPRAVEEHAGILSGSIKTVSIKYQRFRDLGYG